MDPKKVEAVKKMHEPEDIKAIQRLLSSVNYLAKFVPHLSDIVGSWTRILTATERNHAQIEKKLLAIVFACEKFDQYVYGREKVHVQSDHKPLEVIFRIHMDQICTSQTR